VCVLVPNMIHEESERPNGYPVIHVLILWVVTLCSDLVGY